MKYTKYEMARIIGARALQISMGAPFLVKMSESDLERVKFSPIEIAKIEFKDDVIPITVKRPHPSERKIQSRAQVQSIESKKSVDSEASESEAEASEAGLPNI